MELSRDYCGRETRLLHSEKRTPKHGLQAITHISVKRYTQPEKIHTCFRTLEEKSELPDDEYAKCDFPDFRPRKDEDGAEISVKCFFIFSVR